MRYETWRMIGAVIAVLVVPLVSQGGTLESDVTLQLGISGMQSFAHYTYHYTATEPPPHAYEQYHTIVNGDAYEWTTVNTDIWSNNLSSSIDPEPPNCYNARITITVSSGLFACCLSDQYFYREAGVQCVQGPPDDNGHLHSEGGTPILVNLAAGGPWSLGDEKDPVAFDLRADGSFSHWTWTKEGSSVAFLALDRSGNGIIDDGRELFGDQNGPANGFELLRSYDSSGDGLISGSDDVWPRLLLWTDANHNGVSEPHELITPASAGVEAFGVDYHATSRTDREGNVFRYQSLVHIGGRVEPYYDVVFRPVE